MRFAFWLLLPIVFAVPYVTTPLAIDNVVNLQNASDYAVFKIKIVNPDPVKYYYYFQQVSVSWNIIYPKGLYVLDPNTEKEIVVKLRPIRKTTEMPVLSIVIQNDTKKFSYDLYFPILIIDHRENPPNKTKEEYFAVDISLISNRVFAGQTLPIFIEIYSSKEQEIPIIIKSSIFTLNTTVKVQNKTDLTLPIHIPTAVAPGEYSICVKVDGVKRTFNITVLKPLEVVVNKTDKAIIVYNPNDYVVEYTLKKEITLADKLFYKYIPKPDYELIANNKHYYVWNIVLLPHEKLEIIKSLNLLNTFVFALLIVLALAYIILTYLSPKLRVEKEILKIDSKNNEIKIMITLKNKSLYKLKNVKVKEELLPIFEPIDFEFVKPIGVYEKGNKKIIEWIIDELYPGEERVLVYKVKYKSEVVGELELDPTVVEFKVFKQSFVVKSNSLFIRFV